MSSSLRTPKAEARRVQGPGSEARTRLRPIVPIVALAGACQPGPAEHEPAWGPDLHVIAAEPGPAEGLACDASDGTCGVPVDAVLRLRFDRFLHPSTAVRQSVNVYSGSPDHGLFLEPRYDIVERVLSLVPTGGLLAGVVYTVELKQPTSEDEFGFRAYDGAPLAPGSVPRVWSFRTRSDGFAGTPPVAPVPLDCPTSIATLRASCGLTDCHATCPTGTCSRQPRMGLVLDSLRGVLDTAVWQVAHETLLGQDESTPLRNPARFGAQMPIIEPGRPENSYLVYKLLLSPDSYRDGAGVSSASRYFGELPASECLAPSAAERERLMNWFVLPSPMPPEPAELDPASPLLALRIINAWIASGDMTSGCNEGG